ncbi:MAG: aminoacyl-histidine dipeptidase [Campylobacter hyointestinalis]
MRLKVIEYFKEICKIPHCSYETDELRVYLADFASKNGFKVDIDKFGNIHAIKGHPKVCLQAHYDMVCVGLAPKIELINEGGFLSAKNSSLGSDNGIGVAIIMDAMSEFCDLEVLITNNEEVGLLGANGFSGSLASKFMLNLDSEDENGVFIGCASGVSIFASLNLKRTSCEKNLYEVSVSGLPGGHSGIEIIKNIPNAIKVLNEFLLKNGCELVSFDGGERNNSIPVSARAIVVSDHALMSDEICKVKDLGKQKVKVIQSSEVLDFINAFSQGIRSYDEELKIVNESINLSIIKTGEDILEIEFFARAMSDDGLERIKSQMQSLANLAKFQLRYAEQTSAWKPKITDFAKVVLQSMQKFNKNAKFEAVHAGLECGVLLNKSGNKIDACSIGPNIFSPHSINEKCEIRSVNLISKVVREILKSV